MCALSPCLLFHCPKTLGWRMSGMCRFCFFFGLDRGGVGLLDLCFFRRFND